MKILIAEDEPISRRILEDSLHNWGYEVIATKNGLQAWEVLQQENRPSLVVLDWMMPGMDGIDICKRLRSMETVNYVYIILLTARKRREDIVKGLEAGADDYIVKPFNHEELKYRLKIGERIIGLEQRILRMARTDSLTGLLNRRAFMERLEAEISRTQRGKGHLGIVIADIDHFKRVNDSYGHQAGDVVLTGFSSSLYKACRKYDFCGRYGGEEFIICLPGASSEETWQVAERLRKFTENHEILINNIGVNIKITASFGIDTLFAGENKNIDNLIKHADEALYKAKTRGRNKVVVYENGVIDLLSIIKKPV